MENKTLLGTAIALIAALVIAIGQLMLKKASGKDWGSHIREYLNFPVIAAYVLSFAATFANVFALKMLPVAIFAAINGSGQIFVPLLSRIFLNEKMSKRKWLGIAIIVVGIVIVSL